MCDSHLKKKEVGIVTIQHPLNDIRNLSNLKRVR